MGSPSNAHIAIAGPRRNHENADIAIGLLEGSVSPIVNGWFLWLDMQCQTDKLYNLGNAK